MERATGGIITEAGGWIIHRFLASGTLEVLRPVTLEYLIVAGGGGGGARNASAGGGGAGGVLYGSLAVEPGVYPVTVGVGGEVGKIEPTTREVMAGKNGSDSVCFGLTAIGGGGGGPTIGSNSSAAAGHPGGSGGGGGVTYQNHTGGPGGEGYPSQGHPGGSGLRWASGSDRGGGGGGGAGGPGMDAGPGGRALGGPGLVTDISGEPVTYAVGGRGGWVGDSDMQAGLPNSGNGGDGSSSDDGVFVEGAPGGSGIVIVRYRDPWIRRRLTTMHLLRQGQIQL